MFDLFYSFVIGLLSYKSFLLQKIGIHNYEINYFYLTKVRYPHTLEQIAYLCDESGICWPLLLCNPITILLDTLLQQRMDFWRDMVQNSCNSCAYIWVWWLDGVVSDCNCKNDRCVVTSRVTTDLYRTRIQNYNCNSMVIYCATFITILFWGKALELPELSIIV